MPPLSMRNCSLAQPMTPASPQGQSPLFTKLPPELRLHIYRQLWLDLGLTQHILTLSDQTYLQSFPCILGPEQLNWDPSPPPAPTPDVAGDAPGNGNAGSGGGNDDAAQPQPLDDLGDINAAVQDLDADGWGGVDGASAAIRTPWCVHYPCMRLWAQKWQHSLSRMYSAAYRFAPGRDPPDLRGSLVLTAFLVCKRVYWEASESLFSSVRFSFASMTALSLFVWQVPHALAARVQFADIVAAHLLFGDGLADRRTPIEQVYETLTASFPRLRELRLTAHPREGTRETLPRRQDLEPLYALASDMHSLRKLEVFLPTRYEGHGEVRYGEAPPLLDDAPFTIRVVPPGWHAVNDCLPYNSPAQS